MHVLVIQASRYHTHELTGDPHHLYAYLLSKYLSAREINGGHRIGELTKKADMRNGIISSIALDDEDNSPAFLALLKSLVHLCQRHYQALDTNKIKECLKEPPFIDIPLEDLYAGVSPLKKHAETLAIFEVACGSADWIRTKSTTSPGAFLYSRTTPSQLRSCNGRLQSVPYNFWIEERVQVLRVPLTVSTTFTSMCVTYYIKHHNCRSSDVHVIPSYRVLYSNHTAIRL